MDDSQANDWRLWLDGGSKRGAMEVMECRGVLFPCNGFKSIQVN